MTAQAFGSGLGGIAVRDVLAATSLAVLATLAVAALLAPWIAPHDPGLMQPALRLRPPSAEFWLGTDAFGRDILSRALLGGRVSLSIGIAVALVATAAGIGLGLLAGSGRIADALTMRTMDGLMAIPGILLAIALLAMAGGSAVTVVAAISLVETPRVTRLVRSLVLSVRSRAYVEAARLAGTGPVRVMLRHILPNIAAPLVVQTTFVAASAILIEAYLSFLGVGIPPETPSWGNMIADGRRYVLVSINPVLTPALFLAAAVLAINILGDRARDRLDPQLAGRL